MKRIGLAIVAVAAFLACGCRQYDEYTQGFRYKPEFDLDYINYLAPAQPGRLDLEELAR